MSPLPRRIPSLAFIAQAGVLVATIAGCGPALHPVPSDPVQDPAVLLDAVRARAARQGTMAAEARLSGRSDRGSARGRVSILADAAGSRLRVDAWTPTDDLVATLAADPEGFGYFERGAGACLAGPACRERLRLMLPLGLDLRDAVRALFGIPPGIDEPGPWTIAFDRRLGAYRLESVPAPEAAVRVWIREDGAVTRAQRVEAGLEVFRIDFGEFGADGLPRTLDFRATGDDAQVSIRYREIEREPALAPGDWALSCPRGLPTRRLPCEETP
ncbi:MAG TPA: hypothetical protein PK313_11670 [Myxococcota bacterium]|jgi:hypothetical protein|nr:hypothetical protein [Myxococcota bacterium]